ncbi:MAG: L-aspartate oxidase [Phycisphaerae bacterium]|nr:L-aspartate oxidase [Phycisphaerae bacterium]
MSEPLESRRYLIPFRSLLLPHIVTDTLVIGSGVAGLRTAIEASDAGHDVIVIAKDALDFSNTAWAQGGIAAVLSDDDSNVLHIEDTLAAGAGLCMEETVRTVVDEGAAQIEQLVSWGMRLDRDSHGALQLGREGGHHRNRIVHADGDATGRELARCLIERAKAVSGGARSIRLFERCFALDLISGGSAGSPVLGAITHHPRFGLQIIWAKAVVLACGGAGQIYRETTNPKVATGDGIAMAWRAGAAVADLEFMQFHPTTLYVAGASRALLSEAIRGEGGFLVDRRGNRFMIDRHEMAELAPRDIVSRTIMEHLETTHDSNVFLDVRHLAVRPGTLAGTTVFSERFPGLAAMLRSYDLDPARDMIPVHPAAHYTIGGVWVDQHGRTSVPGLYAVGEVSCNGLHGANRLASNSLLEGLVFGARVGRAVAERSDASRGPVQIVSDIRPSDKGELDLVDVRSSLRSAMWWNVGIKRHGGRLDDAEDMLAFWSRYSLDKIFDDLSGWEVQNLLTVASLMTRAAGWRRESRGTHYRLDYPERDEKFAVHALWRTGHELPTLRSLAGAGAVATASETRSG